MPIDQDTEKKSLKEFQERFGAMDEHRQSIEDKLREGDDNFRMLRRGKGRSFKESQLSSLRTPLTFSHVVSIAVRNYLALFSTNKLIGVERSAGTDEVKARIIEGLVNNDLRRIVGSMLKFFVLIQTKVKDGYCPAKFFPINGGVPFRGFDLVPIMRQNFWWDPLAGITIDDARDVIYRVFRGKEWFEYMGELHKTYGDGFGYDRTAVARVLDVFDRGRVESEDVREGGPSELYYPPHKGVSTVYEHWKKDRQKTFAMIGNEKILLRPDEWGNPYRTEKSSGMGMPFIMAVDLPLLGEISGLGVAETLIMPQEEIDTKHNQSVDLANRIINRQVKVRSGVGKKTKDELSNPSPNGILEVDEMDDIAEFGIVGGYQVPWQEINYLGQQADEGTGNYPQVRGSPMGSRRTATEFAGITEKAMPRHAVRILLDGETILKPLAIMDLWMSREFRTEEEVVRIVGEDGLEYDEMIRAEDIDPTIGIYPVPTASVEPKALKQQNLIKFMQLISPLAQTGQIDLMEMIELIGESLEIPNLHKIIRPSLQGGGEMGNISQEESAMTGASPEADRIAKLLSSLNPPAGMEGQGGGRPRGNGGLR